MKIQVTLGVVECEVVNRCRRIGGEFCLHFQGKVVQEECFIPKTQAPYSSETSVNVYNSTRPRRFKLHVRLQCLLQTFCDLIFSEVPSTSAQKGLYVLM